MGLECLSQEKKNCKKHVKKAHLEHMYEHISQTLRTGREHIPHNREAASLRCRRARHIGCEISEFDTVDSTQLEARRLLEEGAASGTVAIACEQTAGRGRLGRAWQSERDAGLYFSVILRPELSEAASRGFKVLSLAAGVAVMQVLRRRYGLDALIKWPNDVFINGRKVCGILVEGTGGGAFILGIGINTNWQIDEAAAHAHIPGGGAERSLASEGSSASEACIFLPQVKKCIPLSPQAERGAGADVLLCGTSLSLELSRDIDHPALLIHILESLDIVYAGLCRGYTRFVLGRVRRHLFGIGREVFFESDGTRRSGVLEGIDDEGRALVRAEGRIQAVTAGEVCIADRN